MERDISYITNNAICSVKTEIEFIENKFVKFDKEMFYNMEFVAFNQENECGSKSFKIERQEENNARYELKDPLNIEKNSTGVPYVQSETQPEQFVVNNVISVLGDKSEKTTKREGKGEKSKCYSNASNVPSIECESHVYSKQNENYKSTEQIFSVSNYQYTCHICEKNFSFKNSLQRHHLIHTKTKSYSCGICNKLFLRRGDMTVHYKRHKNKNSTLFIDDTQKGYSLSEYKEEDSELSVQNCVNICDVCNTSFANKSSLKRHMLIHIGIKNYLCIICSKSFTRKWDLNVHYKRHGNETDENRSYICDLCGKTFSSKVYIYQHMQSHAPDRCYKCHLCTKVYKWQGTLQEHLKTHRGIEKNHICEICTKPFRRFKELKEHVVVHTGEKSHVCMLCDKAYSWKSDLRKHIKIHTEDIHICHMCGKTFNAKQNLTRHMVIHTRVSRYKCWICYKSFRDNRYLKKHINSHIDRSSVIKNEEDSHTTLSSLLDYFNV